MSWRLARSLEVLRSEINVLAPGRSKASDGTIGDQAHAARYSDHNINPAGVVCAFDATHDPASGADMVRLSEHIRTHPPLAAKYVIWNRRIASRDGGWRWERYTGPNPHDKHMHVSVGRGADGHSTGPYDDTSSWGISSSASTGDDAMGHLNLKKGDSGDRVEALQIALGYAGFAVTVDGDYGAKTAAAVLAMRKWMGSTATDGDKMTPYATEQLGKAVARREARAAAEDVEGEPGPVGPRAGGLYELRPVEG